jgi:polyisoprenoid-binding protein YceI
MLKLFPLVALASSAWAATLTPPPKPQPPAQVATRYVADSSGNKARYRVRERLVGNELDNDAVGETQKVSGTIALDKAGKIIPTESGFTVELASLKSDQERRDGFVRRRLLVTDTFPSTRFQVTEVKGLPSKLPTSGTSEFQLIGNLTVKGVTRPTTWNVKATVTGNRLTGSAATKFTFADFQLTQPKVPVLLSVVDTIALEYDFAMTKQAK